MHNSPSAAACICPCTLYTVSPLWLPPEGGEERRGGEEGRREGGREGGGERGGGAAIDKRKC